MADRRAGELRSRGDHLRRGQPRRREAQAQLERIQPGPARSPQRRLRRDARRRRSARLVLRQPHHARNAQTITKNKEAPMKRTTDGTGLTRRTALKTLSATTVLVSGALAAPAIIRRAAAQDPIRIGVISPLTGAWTVYGKAHSAGFQMAVDEINEKGGVLGRPLEIVLGDSKTEPRIVVEQANRLIRQERVDFLAGTFSS